MSRHRGVWTDRRGGTLVLVAVTMVALLGTVALAVDVGFGLTARSEAQRIADASALAGGSAFLDYQPAPAVQIAEDRAYEYALLNNIRGVAVDSAEVTVQVDQAERKVRVWVVRQGLGTWFARLLGIGSMDVAGYAAAEAAVAGTARCLKPFALPDSWGDGDDDADSDRIWDDGEEWEFEAENDSYKRYEGNPGDVSSTGLGSGYRDGWADDDGNSYTSDYGRPIDIKLADPNSEYVPSPGVFLPWRIPEDESMEACGNGPVGEQGGKAYRENICACNASPVELFTPYPIEPGNMVGPTDQGISALEDQDPDAEWKFNSDTGRYEVYSPIFGWGLASPRVMKVGMIDPLQIQGSGMQDIEFNNFALLFLQGQADKHAPVVARFLYYVGGDGEPGDGETGGTLTYVLRLVE